MIYNVGEKVAMLLTVSGFLLCFPAVYFGIADWWVQRNIWMMALGAPLSFVMMLGIVVMMLPGIMLFTAIDWLKSR